MTHIFLLNECNFLKFFWLTVCGRKPIFLFANPNFYFTGKMLELFCHCAGKIGIVNHLASLSDDLPWAPTFPLEKNFTSDLYPIIADKVHEEFAVNPGDTRLAQYKYPFKKALTDYVVKIGDLALIRHWLDENFPTGNWEIHGETPIGDKIYRVYAGQDCDSQGKRGLCSPRLFNFLNIAGAFLAGLVWLIIRTRFRSIKRKYYRLAGDRVSSSDMEFYGQIITNTSEFLIVDRNSDLAEKYRGSNGEHESCLKDDTRISLTLFLNLIAKMVMDLWCLWRQFGSFDPGLFGNLGLLCVKRAMFAAFFSEYRPRFFFGRDDYSKDHIIRNQELRRIGGISLGINHGLPLNTITPAWQEVDFDIYYAFGSHLFTNTLQKTWPSECIVKPVGSKNMLPAYRSRLKDARPKDIAFFPIIHTRFEQNMHAVFAVARYFSDRRMFIKLKGNRRPEQICDYHRLLRTAPENVVVYTDPNPYELLLTVSYSIAFTTLVAESIQFRAITFTLDTDPSIQHLYYRNWPSLLVSGGEDIIARINAIESGQERYDFNNYNELIKRDSKDIFQIIREDIGLV